MKRCGRERRLKTENPQLISQLKRRNSSRLRLGEAARAPACVLIAVPQDLGPAVPAALAALAAAPDPEARRHAARALTALSGRAR